DATLPAQVYALAPLFGREKDVRCLNFMVASEAKDSSTFNRFAWANADAIREMLLSQVEQNPLGGAGGGDNKVFMQRAAALLGAWTPILVWLRGRKRVPIDISSIRFATELESVASIAFHKRFRRLDVPTGAASFLDVPDIPEALLHPLRAYLGDTGGYDASLPFNKQRTDEPAKQHSFVTMHFTHTFTQLAVSLGHIFGRGWSDIDMHDVVLNRRILVATLPAMENSGETTAALGKLTVAALRDMMAQTPGGRLEGDHAEIVENRPAVSPTPFFVPMDEVAAFAGGGIDTLLQQARGLGVSIVLGWHDVAGLRARIGERVWTLLNNATTAIYMRQNVGGENRQLVEGSVGDADVTRTAGYGADGGGAFREARRVDVRRTARVDWRDLRGLIEGEAVVVQGNRRVYAKLFHAAVDARGALRLNRPVPLPPPEPERVRRLAGRLDAVRRALETAEAPPDGPPSPVLAAVLAGFRTGLDAGLPVTEAASAAANAAGAVPDAPPALHAPEPPPLGGVPRSDFTPTLEAAAAARPPHAEATSAAAAAVSRQAADMLRDIAAIEEAGGKTPEEARR
ncbi:MAG: type IV secretion system DNA-binding domain-containing protein, partial [Acetobacteraceae bacterium]|nr:type IV secretion system DNA-binding domain-containing protein [Acetobacteraceae bacterium]